MKITETRFRKVDKGNLIATCSATLDDIFVITGIKVCDGKNGNFVSFPSTKYSDGSYHDICYPKTKESRESFEKTILKHFGEWAKKEGTSDGKGGFE